LILEKDKTWRNHVLDKFAQHFDQLAVDLVDYWTGRQTMWTLVLEND